MSLKLNSTPGHLYFLSEMDVLRNERTPYIKIGIVKNERTSKDRIFEHQTGNPRKIHLEKELETPFVSNIETIIHHLYNQKRVATEWFMLTDKEMDGVYNRAADISLRFKDTLEYFEEIQKFKTSESAEIVVTPTLTQEAVETYSGYKDAKLRMEIAKVRKSLCIESLKRNAEGYAGIEDILVFRSKRGQTRFDETKFKKEHLKRYESFLVSEIKLSESFSVDDAPTGKHVDEALRKELKELQSLNESLSLDLVNGDNIKKREAADEVLHQEYLEADSAYYEACMDAELRKVEIQMLHIEFDNTSEIRGFSKWKREKTTKQSFVKGTLKEKNPDLYSKYLVASEDTFQAKVFSEGRVYLA